MKILILVVCAMAASAKVEVHGHRGARAAMPENTMPAFEYAIAQGADVLELDMQVTRDNVVVVSHDPVMHAPICTGPKEKGVIRQMTLAEVREWDCGAVRNPAYPLQKTVPGTRMPTLEEVFALAPRGAFLFNIETKMSDKPGESPEPEEFARLVLDIVRKHKLENRVILQSFDFRTLKAMRKLAPEIKRAALYAGMPKDFVSLTREAEADMVSPVWQLVNKGRVEKAHAAGIPVVPWTANKPEQWDKLIAAGVDAIITDDPAGLIAHLKTKGLR
jgi:glycerophosphoryl diester phosphodiesterase